MKLFRFLAFSVALAGCGSDFAFAVRFTSGTIVDGADCDGDDGRFDLREDGGLVVVVIVDGDSRIRHLDGSPAACDDLNEGTEASARGPDEDGGIRAREVNILAGA